MWPDKKQGHTVHKTAKEKHERLMKGIKTNKKQEEIQEQSYHTTKTTFEDKNYEFGYVPKPKYFVG